MIWIGKLHSAWQKFWFAKRNKNVLLSGDTSFNQGVGLSWLIKAEVGLKQAFCRDQIGRIVVHHVLQVPNTILNKKNGHIFAQI